MYLLCSGPFLSRHHHRRRSLVRRPAREKTGGDARRTACRAPCDDARGRDARRCACVCACLLIKGQTDSGGTDGRQLKGWKIVSLAGRAAVRGRGGRNEGGEPRAPQPTAAAPAFAPHGRHDVSGRRLSRRPFNSLRPLRRPCPRAPRRPVIIIIVIKSPNGPGRRFREIRRKIADRFPTVAPRLLLMTLFRRPFDYDVFLTAAAAAHAPTRRAFL